MNSISPRTSWRNALRLDSAKISITCSRASFDEVIMLSVNFMSLLLNLNHFFLTVLSMSLGVKDIRASAGIEPAEPKFAVPTERHLFARLLAWPGNALGGSLAA